MRLGLVLEFDAHAYTAEGLGDDDFLGAITQLGARARPSQSRTDALIGPRELVLSRGVDLEPRRPFVESREAVDEGENCFSRRVDRRRTLDMSGGRKQHANEEEQQDQRSQADEDSLEHLHTSALA
jgi:hypothetical protein